MSRAAYLRMGLANGLSIRETLMLPPGELLDLWDAYLASHGVKREREVT